MSEITASAFQHPPSRLSLALGKGLAVHAVRRAVRSANRLGDNYSRAERVVYRYICIPINKQYKFRVEQEVSSRGQPGSGATPRPARTTRHATIHDQSHLSLSQLVPPSPTRGRSRSAALSAASRHPDPRSAAHGLSSHLTSKCSDATLNIQTYTACLCPAARWLPSGPSTCAGAPPSPSPPPSASPFPGRPAS